MQNLSVFLQRIKSKIAYMVDTWTTPQMVFSFAGTIASFIDDDWKLVERLIDFKQLDDDDHQGKNAAKSFMKSASSRGGLDKISCLLNAIFENGN